MTNFHFLTKRFATSIVLNNSSKRSFFPTHFSMNQIGIKTVSISLISFLAGYLVNSYWFRPCTKNSKRINHSNESESYDESEESDDDLEIDSSDLNSIPGEVRMTLIVRQDLKMGKGKAAAQCSHATLALYKKMTNPQSPAYNPEMIRRWEYGNGQAKITLQMPDQENMDILYAQAISVGLNAYVVHDAGRTQIAAGSATVLGLGPAPKSVIDQITKELKLY